MSKPQFLSNDDFTHVIRLAPLVSIDILVKDPDNYVLVGMRVNEPAKGRYFVPGGVIRKNETIAKAFKRILKVETGSRASIREAKLIGAYEHFYTTNRFGSGDYGTHYVVLAYELKLRRRPMIKPDAQHSDMRWMSGAEIL